MKELDGEAKGCLEFGKDEWFVLPYFAVYVYRDHTAPRLLDCFYTSSSSKGCNMSVVMLIPRRQEETGAYPK